MSITGIYYDGLSSKRHDVTLSVSDTSLHIKGVNLDLIFKLADLQVKPRLASLPVQIVFPNDSHCELQEQDGLSDLVATLSSSKTQTFIHKIETRITLILLTLVISVATLFITIRYAIPFAAKHVAYSIPLSVESDMAEEGLTLLDKVIFQPSKLPESRKQELIDYFNKMAGTQDKPLDIRFRSAKKMGENAFALPSGIIVFTDEMIHFAKDDRELFGILAHEIGHVHKRHVLRHILQDSATSLLLILITGDIGTASSLIATVPTVLIQAKFSREFESESDDYAISFLKQRGISTQYLADILARLQQKHHETDSEISAFISSHPATSKRLQKLRFHQN